MSELNTGRSGGYRKNANEGESVIRRRKADMTIILENALEVSSITLSEGKCNLDDYEDVKKRINQYLKIIAKNGTQPTIVGMSSAMGVDRATISEIHNGHRTVRDVRVKELIDQMYSVTLMALEDGMQAGIVKEVTGIFLLKNNYGYRDQQDVVVRGGNLLGEAKSEHELIATYEASVPLLEE